MKKFLIYLFVFFSLSLLVLTGYTIQSSYKVQEELLSQSLKNKAITIFNLIVDMRHWNAQFEGVYVKSYDLEPNPYLKPNYIKSSTGDKLVWVNPAFMTRQISNIASKRDNLKLKITSNKLINKNNAPDEYEKKVLKYFDKNPNIPYYWEINNRSFKFMGALKTEKSCLACHSIQGYKVGDNRGGVSVSFDVKDEFKKLDIIKKKKEVSIIFLIVATIGAILTLLIHQNIKKIDEEKISNLNETLKLKLTQLDEFNKTLSLKVKEEVEQQRQKENLLIQQSKLATLGEMIGNIAHQWRQPITAVSAIIMNIKWTAISQGLDEQFLEKPIKEANGQLRYMSQTIDDFRNFFKPTKKKELFDLKDSVKQAYKIMKGTLENHRIDLQIYNQKQIKVFGYSNEFSQVVLNLISNAKDVLIQREILKAKIEIYLHKDDKYAYCKIKDNGKGIKEDIKDKIFEPYFTTKKSSGTGIGLYISKEIIVKHMQGTLEVENTKDGAVFIISIPLFERENL